MITVSPTNANRYFFSSAQTCRYYTETLDKTVCFANYRKTKNDNVKNMIAYEIKNLIEEGNHRKDLYATRKLIGSLNNDANNSLTDFQNYVPIRNGPQIRSRFQSKDVESEQYHKTTFTRSANHINK